MKRTIYNGLPYEVSDVTLPTDDGPKEAKILRWYVDGQAELMEFVMSEEDAAEVGRMLSKPATKESGLVEVKTMPSVLQQRPGGPRRR